MVLLRTPRLVRRRIGMIPAMAGPTARKHSNATADQATISKTQRKRASLSLQDLGKELTRLSAEQLAELELPDRLLDAVLAAQRISKFGALRRQLQYVGRLMHDVDAEAIAARLRTRQGVSREANAYLHRLERWRARLLQDETALEELAESFPGSDTQRLRELVRSARREELEGKPPRSSRALFQELRRILPPDPGTAE
jgi:ribosome-associated protein